MYKTKLNKIGNIIERVKNDISLPIISEFLEWFYKKIDINFNKHTPNIIVNIGDIYDVELGINIGSELNKKRPCVVISKGNYNKGNTIIIVPLRSIKENSRLGTLSFEIDVNSTGLEKRSYITTMNIKEISKKRLLSRIGKLNNLDIIKLKEAILKLFDIEKPLSK